MYSLKRTVIAHLYRTSYRTFISHNMANIFLVSHILLLFHSPKGSWYKLAKYEKLGKYWSYCTQNRAITNASCTQYRTVQDYSNSNLHSLNTIFSWKKQCPIYPIFSIIRLSLKIQNRNLWSLSMSVNRYNFRKSEWTDSVVVSCNSWLKNNPFFQFGNNKSFP